MYMNRKLLHHKLSLDMQRLHHLIVREATGERDLKRKREQLEGAVNIKIALLFFGPGEKAKEHPVLG